MSGYRMQELLAMRIPDLETIETAADTHTRIQKIIEQGEDRFDSRHRHKDGTIFDVEISVQYLPIEGGRLVVFLRNITERKRAEKERENLINELEAAFDEVKTLSAISETVNQSLDIDQVLNDALERIMEFFKPHSAHIRFLDNKTQEFVLAAQKGLGPEDLKKLPKRQNLGVTISRHTIKSLKAIVIEDILTDPLSAGKQTFCEKIGCRTLVTLPLCHKDKMLGHMCIHGREPGAFTADEIRLFTSIGHQVGTAIENASLYRDLEVTIKELNEMQDKLRQSQKMEAIGTLAGGIAHDFNNILSPIMIHTEMAMMALPSGSPLQQNMKGIYKAGQRATDLVKQILTFARRQEKELIPLSVSRILKEVIKLLRSSIPTTVDIQYDIISEQDTVLSDPTQMNQIIMNLCTNAAHAMEENGGTLEVILNNENLDTESADAFPDLEPGRYVKLTVKDTGQGIDPQLMDKIFEPYFTTKDVGNGTGMGLALVHGIVKSHGGAVTVYSEVGKGTSFHVYLPLVEEDTDILETAKDSVQLPTGTERILFVDDEKAAVDVMQSMLEKLGYKVTARTSSIEALEAFRNKPQEFDLVITDMTMPNMTGKDLAKELMTIRPDIPIILCTGFSEKIDERIAEEMGIRAFVMKPIVMRQIADTIREVLGNSKERSGQG